MCVGDGGWCTADGDCCSGSCVSNYCAAAAPAPSTGGDTGGAMTSGATSGGSTTTSAPVAVNSMPNTGVGQPGDAPDWLAPAAAAGLAVTAAYAAGRARKQDREDESVR